MPRLAPALLAALALAGCGGGSDRKPEPAGNGAPPEHSPEVDLEAECRAASTRWSTLQARYDAEGSTSVRVTIAYERGGRAALHLDPGESMVLDGGLLRARVQTRTGEWIVATVPMGHFFAAVAAIRQGKPLPAAGACPPIPSGHVVTDISLSVDERGRAQRNAVLAVALGEVPAFGWLELLRPREGFTVRADGRTAVISGPCGRVAIDRDTGSLVEWILDPPGGRPARFRRESIAVDAPLEPALFRLEGKPASEQDSRAVARDYMVPLALELVGKERDWNLRLARTLDLARAWYRSAWGEAEIRRLGDLGAARRREIAAELRKNNPDLPQADIDAASARTALPTIGDAVGPETSYDARFFAGLAQPTDRESEAEFREGLEQVIIQELLERALEAGKDR